MVYREGSRVLICDFTLRARTQRADLGEQVEQCLSSGGIGECAILGKLGVSVVSHSICKVHGFLSPFHIFFLFDVLLTKKAERGLWVDKLKVCSKSYCCMRS
jgi:hypothetical protein